MSSLFTEIHGNHGRVLLADDDETTRQVLGKLLSSSGYEVLTADNGQLAFEKAMTLSPAAVLLDVRMPGLDGFEVCRRLKADPRTASIPVLILTALAERADLIKGVASGADDFLSKPVDREELVLRVRNAVYRKHLFDELARKYAELKAMAELHESLVGLIEADTGALSSLMHPPAKRTGDGGGPDDKGGGPREGRDHGAN